MALMFRAGAGAARVAASARLAVGCVNWGTWRDRGNGFCANCGLDLGWHVGHTCLSPSSTGMPRPIEIPAATGCTEPAEAGVSS